MYDFESKLNRKKTYASKWMVRNTKNEEYSEDIIPLSVADMEFKVMDEIKDALHKAVDEMNPYGYQATSDSYLQSIISWMQRHHHVKVDKDWIVLSHGVVEALVRSVKAYTKENDGVIIFTPVYPPFFKAARSNKTRIVECPLILKGQRYEIDFTLFEKQAKQSDNKILILCSPHNPIGKVFTREELARIVSICKENDLILVVDEIHHDCIMEGYVHTNILSFLNVYDQIILCTAASKSFNLAGLQTSNIIIPDEKLRTSYIGEDHVSINPLSMAATECAYRCGDQWIREMMHVVGINYKTAADFFASYFPKAWHSELQGTYLMWVDMNAYFENEDDMFAFLYDEACFIVNKGSTFGKNGEGFMRINLALPTDQLKIALKRLYDAYEKRSK